MIRFNLKSINFIVFLIILGSCSTPLEKVSPIANNTPTGKINGPFLNLSANDFDLLKRKNAKPMTEILMSKVSNHRLTAGSWLNVFNATNNDPSATFKGQIYNNGGNIDLYAYTKNKEGNYERFTGTSGSLNPKSFTFNMTPGVQYYFFAYSSTGTTFDAALYMITGGSSSGSSGGNNTGTSNTVSFNKSLVSGTNYRHFCQLDGTISPNYACIPTSYMIARGIIYSNKSVSKTELTRISNGMYLASWGTSLTNAANFASIDIKNCQNVLAKADIEWAKNYIKDAINSGRPLLAVTNLRSQHIVTVVGLKLTNSDETSEIFYIDPYNRNPGVSSIKLSSFLTSMRTASAYGIHNFLIIGC